MLATRNLLGLLLLSTALAGCTHGAYSRAAIGRLTLALRPQSMDGVKRAVLELSGLQLERAGAGPLRYHFHPPRIIMLAHDTLGNDSVLLDRQTLPAGTYTGVRLLLDPAQHGVDSFAEMPGGGIQELKSVGKKHGYLAVEKSFVVPASGRRRVVLRVSLRREHTSLARNTVSVVPSLELDAARGDKSTRSRQQGAS